MSEGLVIAAGGGGKSKTALQMVGILFLILGYPYHFDLLIVDFGVVDFVMVGRALIYISLIFSVLSAFEYGKLFLSALDEAGPLLPPTNGAAASAPTITSSSSPQRPPGRPNKVPLPSRRRRPAGCAPTCQPLRAPSSCPRPSPKS